MPGPMSVPNGSNQSYKFIINGREVWISIHDLTADQRMQLAEKGKLNTGKTRKKRMNTSGGAPFM